MSEQPVLLVRALDALVHWSAPPAVAGQLRTGALADLVVDDVFDATVEASYRWSEHGDGLMCVNDGEHLLGRSLDEVLAETLIALNRLAARSVEHERLVLHAGVTVFPGLGAVAMCGASGAGKSTATAAAALAGFEFVADEVCAVEPSSWTVRPYLRPVGLRRGGAEVLGLPGGDPWSWWRPPNRADSDVPLGAVVLLQRGTGSLHLHRLGAPDALTQLVDHAISSPETSRSMFRRLADLVRRVPVYELQYDHAPAAVEHLAAHLR